MSPSGYKDIGIRKLEFDVSTQFLFYTEPGENVRLNLYLSFRVVSITRQMSPTFVCSGHPPHPVLFFQLIKIYTENEIKICVSSFLKNIKSTHIFYCCNVYNRY